MSCTWSLSVEWTDCPVEGGFESIWGVREAFLVRMTFELEIWRLKNIPKWGRRFQAEGTTWEEVPGHKEVEPDGRDFKNNIKIVQWVSALSYPLFKHVAMLDQINWGNQKDFHAQQDKKIFMLSGLPPLQNPLIVSYKIKTLVYHMTQTFNCLVLIHKK